MSPKGGDKSCPICEGRKPCNGPEWHCGAKLRSDQAAERGRTKCAMRAGQGTEHVGYGACKLHGGASPNANKSWGARVRYDRAMGEVGTLLADIGVGLNGRTVPEAIADALDRAAQMVYAIGLLLDELPVNTTWHWDEQESRQGGSTYRVIVEEPGLYGPDHLGDQKPHVLVQLYGQWLESYVKVAKVAADLGIAERQQRQREELTRVFVTALRHTLGELGIDVDSPEVVPHVMSGLRLITDGGERVA